MKSRPRRGNAQGWNLINYAAWPFSRGLNSDYGAQHDVRSNHLHAHSRRHQPRGIGSGFVVLFGLIAGKRLDGWTAFFLATTVATSVTGFGFPIHGFTPGIGIGIISLLVLAVAIFARSARRLTEIWCRVYVVTAVIALYLNFFVLIVQSFQKVPVLKTLALTQSEPPFAITQLIALAAFIVLGSLAAIRFRERPVGAA